MDAVSWEKLKKNWEEIKKISQPDEIYVYLYQHGVITETEKEALDACTTSTKQMEELLKLLKRKPSETQAFRHFLHIVQDNSPWLADKIESTTTKSDPRVREPGDPHLLDDSVRTTLRKYFANKQGVLTALSEIRDVLQKELVFTGANEWSNSVLQDFVQHEFVGVKCELKKKREGRKAKKVCYVTNLGRIDPAPSKDQQQPLAETDKSSGNLHVQATVKVSDLSPSDLKKYLKPQFEASGLPAEILDKMEKESITGKVFQTLKDEDLKQHFSSLAFGQRRSLLMLIQENQPVTEAPPYIEQPRPFDGEVSHIHKYYKGRCMDASVNVRGKLTVPVRNFHLCPDADKDSSLDFISSELIPFLSACLNDRRNGTIYFGISPADSDEYKAGEVVGLNLPQEEVNAEINDSLKCSYLNEQSNIIQATVRDAKFIPVISPRSSADSQPWVIEVDVKPSDSILKDDKVRTKMKNLPLHAKRSQSREWAIFTFSDEGKPKVVDSDKVHRYERDQPEKVKHRQMEEEEARRRRVPAPNLRKKLLNLLTGGKETLEDTIFPFIMTSPIDFHMDMEYLSNSTTFIKSLEPEVVFDFDPKGSSDGIYKNLDTEQNEVMRVLTTNDFDTNGYDNKERYGEFIADLKSQSGTLWMFCNGYVELDIKPLNPTKWNRERRQAFENSLRFFLDNFNKERIIVIICLFSKNYEIVIEACEEVLKMLPNNWILLAESEEIARLWQDQVVSRHMVEKDEVIDRCVVGMPWCQVNGTIRQIVGSDEIYDCLVPSSTGALVKISEKKKNQWSDIDILHSGDFPESENNEREMKKAEEQFYRGEKASWLNFWYRDQVLSRDIHKELTKMVENALEGKGIEEEDKVTCVTLLHQPGAGGTTSAKHVLWDLRKDYRCCVVQTITDQTCDQLNEFRRYDDTTPKPLLILIDNEDEEKYLKLIGQLEENGRKLARNADYPMNVYCTIIHCERRAALPLQIKEYQIALRQELTKSELAWFKRTNDRLKSEFEDDKTSNVNPRFLISFNILRENFNKDYISNVMKEFSNSVTSPNEITLLKIVSFLNTFDPTFQWVSVSCLDKLFKNPESFSSKHQPGTLTRNRSWEATLSVGVRVLLNLSSKGKRSEGSKKFVRVINKNAAQEILNNMKDRTGQTESEIITELMESGVFESEQYDIKQLGHLIKNIVKKREFDENGTSRNKFSRFVLHVQKDEGDEVAAELMKRLFELNQDPFIAQLLARFYIALKNWEQAKKYADRAVKLYPTNSFLWDTYGQIFKSQLFEKASLAYAERMSPEEIPELIQLSVSCLEKFRKAQQLSEQETTTLGENNFAGYFGELRTILLLLNTLKMCSAFSNDSGMLQRYLVDKQFYPEYLRFLNEDANKFLKDLENNVQESMRRLDEEYLQIKDKSSFTDTLITAHDCSDKDRLLKLKVNLNHFFGEAGDKVLANLSPSDRCIYNRRKAFHMGSDSLNRLLELRAKKENDTLQHIYKLLIGNITSTMPCSFDDIRSILDTVTVLLIDQKSPSGLKYGMILDWCKQLYQMNRKRPSEGSRIYLEPFLYFVLYNFPTEERLQHNLCLTRELMSAIDIWKEDFMKKHPKCRQEGTRKKETTVFFLGNGQPLKDIVHQDSLPDLHYYSLDDKWQVPRVRKYLRLFAGVLCSGGDRINYQITTGQGNNYNLQIMTSHPVRNKLMWQKQVYFYLGFSFSGPKAFGMSLEELGKSLPTGTKRIPRLPAPPSGNASRDQKQPILEDLMRKKEKLQSDIEKKKDPAGRLEKQYNQVSQEIRSLVGEFF